MEGWWSGLTRLFAKEKDFGSTGSNPVPSSNMWMVAQLVEFWLVTPEVAGSGPVYPPKICGISTVGSAPPCHDGGHRFKPGMPL